MELEPYRGVCLAVRTGHGSGLDPSLVQPRCGLEFVPDMGDHPSMAQLLYGDAGRGQLIFLPRSIS